MHYQKKDIITDDIDGLAGRATHEAIIDVQRANGLRLIFVKNFENPNTTNLFQLPLYNFDFSASFYFEFANSTKK